MCSLKRSEVSFKIITNNFCVHQWQGLVLSYGGKTRSLSVTGLEYSCPSSPEYFPFSSPPSCSKVCPGSFFRDVKQNCHQKEIFLFSSNYFTVTKLPRFFPLPRLKNLSSACSDTAGLLSSSPLWSVSEQTMGRLSPKTAEEEQSYLPMFLFYLLLNYKEYWHVRKEGFCWSAGNQYKQRMSQRFFLFLAWKSLHQMTIQDITWVAIVCYLPSNGGRIISSLRFSCPYKET